MELVRGNIKKIIADSKSGRSDMYRVPLESIAIRPGFNAARESDPEYQAHVEWIAASILANGLYQDQPITALPVDDGCWYVSDGHCRFAAVVKANDMGAGIEYMYVIAEPAGADDIDRTVGLITRNGGRGLTPYGEGLVCKDLIGKGLDEKEIARRTGFALQKVTNLLALVAAPKDVRDMVTTGRVSSTLAIELLKTDGSHAAEALEKAAKNADAKGRKKVMKKDLEPVDEQPSAMQQAFASGNAVSERLAKPKLPSLEEALPSVVIIRDHMSENHRAAISPAAVEIVRVAILQALQK